MRDLDVNRLGTIVERLMIWSRKPHNRLFNEEAQQMKLALSLLNDLHTRLEVLKETSVTAAYSDPFQTVTGFGSL